MALLRCWLSLVLLVGALGSAGAQEAVQPMLRVEAGTHVAAIRALATDARGELLLTASEDKTARLWRLSDRSLLRVLRPPIGADNEGKLYAAALSPDGTVAAVAGWSADNEVYLFDSRSGRMRGRIEGLPNVVNALAFSPDGKQLAVLSWGGAGLRLYASSDDWKTARPTSSDEAYGADAYGLAFSPDGRMLVSSAYDGALRQYALRGNSLWLQKTERIAGRPHGLAFSPDGKRLALGLADTAQALVLHGDTLATVWRSPVLEGGALPCVAWSRQGNELLAAGSWRSAPGRHGVQRWNLARASGSELAAASDSVTALLSAGGEVLFASGDASWGQVGGASVRSMRPDFRLPVAAGSSSLRLSSDARELSFATRFGGLAPVRFDLAGPAWRPAQPLDDKPAALLDVRDWQDSSSPKLAGRALSLGQGEVSLALGIDPSGRGFALGSNHRLRLYAANGQLLWNVRIPAPCFAVQLSRDQHWVVAGFGDGTLRWFRRKDGAETLAFYPHGDGKAWAAWTPDGRFSAGGGGERHIGWHVNRGTGEAAEFLPLERFSERYFDPLGVISALADKPRVRPLPDPRQGLKLPPVVAFLSPSDGSKVNEDSVRLDLHVMDQGGGVDEVRLMHNGKVVQTVGPKPAAPASRLHFELALESGRNEVKAVALGLDRTESAVAELTVQAPARPDRPKLRVLSVGVNAYRNSQLNLSFSVPDARGVANTFKALGRKLFADIAVSELYDGQATRAGILAQLADFSASKPEDVVVVYLAGHGETLGDDWYFIPHEVTQPEQADKLRSEGLSSQELSRAIKAIPARKVVVLIDACKSGAAIASFRGLEERRLLSQLSRSTGTHLIAATNKEQLAAELLNLGHGVFTYTLLEGLSGKAAAGGPDVTARKLMVYVEQTLPELSKRYRTEEQFPVVSSTGMDFPLVVR
ncbi:caspase family protein [Pelomonas sp. SE-A7]|uniref:caspase family protein n=1 Tax=Pelomonas sp. SE-A7 TaxID=3054953 RepID=UPI00259CF8CA|nr:caspase family protein [Pelomonas sp. SE-A7]MDM4767836.1 caspase family protein [Pelomonas sp. SE-A7]